MGTLGKHVEGEPRLSPTQGWGPPRTTLARFPPLVQYMGAHWRLWDLTPCLPELPRPLGDFVPATI